MENKRTVITLDSDLRRPHEREFRNRVEWAVKHLDLQMFYWLPESPDDKLVKQLELASILAQGADQKAADLVVGMVKNIADPLVVFLDNYMFGSMLSKVFVRALAKQFPRLIIMATSPTPDIGIHHVDRNAVSEVCLATILREIMISGR